MTNVELIVGSHQVAYVARTCGCSLVLPHHFADGGVIAKARHVEFDQVSVTPVVRPDGQHPIKLFPAFGPGRVFDRSERTVEAEGGNALWVRRAEHETHRTALRPAVDGRPLAARCIHHHPHVTDPLFEGVLVGCDAIRETLATL